MLTNSKLCRRKTLDPQSCVWHTEALAAFLAGSILMNVNIMWFGVRGMRLEQFDALFGWLGTQKSNTNLPNLFFKNI